MKKIALASLLALGVSGSAFAVTATSGVYVGGLAGWSFPSAPNTSSTQMDATRQDSQPYTFGATIGYDYAFDQNWLAGLEGNYTYFGKETYDNASPRNTRTTNLSLTNSGFQIMLTGTYLDESGFNGFVKVGGIDATTDLSGTVGSQVGYKKVTKFTGAAAAGIGYMPMQDLNIALQYEHVFGSSWGDSSDSYQYAMTNDAVTLGVTYKFGMGS
jgi:opacity protein-like surface antigen